MEIKTWGEALAYTFKTRHTWRHGNGAEAARINTNHFTRHVGLSYPCKKITQPIISQFCIDLEEELKSDATINRIVSAISTVLHHCEDDGLLPSAPRLRRRKEGESRKTWYTKEQVEGLAQAALDPYERIDLHNIILCAAYTGMRQGELLKLKCRDVDFSLTTVHVGGRPDVQSKSKNYRSVPFPDRIEGILRQRIEGKDPRSFVFGCDWNDRDQLMRAFKRVRKYCGISEDHVFHSLRHSYATWLAEADVQLLTIKELMGHASINTTMLYAKVTSQARTAAVNRI